MFVRNIFCFLGWWVSSHDGHTHANIRKFKQKHANDTKWKEFFARKHTAGNTKWASYEFMLRNTKFCLDITGINGVCY